jgi:hypothetical protein
MKGETHIGMPLTIVSIAYILKEVNFYCTLLGIPYPTNSEEAIAIYNAREKAMAQEKGQDPLLARPYAPIHPKKAELRQHRFYCQKCQRKHPKVITLVQLGAY